MSPKLKELMLKRGLPVQAAPTARMLKQLLPWQAPQFSSMSVGQDFLHG